MAVSSVASFFGNPNRPAGRQLPVTSICSGLMLGMLVLLANSVSRLHEPLLLRANARESRPKGRQAILVGVLA
ncbi:MAG: hypothetical protein OQL17_03165 [Sedimenticola sp.]|nr:hypothetical protein [Sedimenticola sp.]